VAQVVYSDIERAFEFLAENNLGAAVSAVDAIRGSIDMLGSHPFIGRRVTETLRELVISYGRTGYVALYRYLPEHDLVRVLALRHQRELDYPG